MKNLISAFSVLLLAISFISCEKQNLFQESTVRFDESQIESIGIIHNEYLQYLYEEITDDIFTKSDSELLFEKLEIMSSFNPLASKATEKFEMNIFSNSVTNRNLSLFYNDDFYELKKTDIQLSMNNLHSKGLINNTDIIIFERLNSIINSSISEKEFGKELVRLDKIVSKSSTSYLRLSEIMLTVANHSYDFWANNEDAVIKIHGKVQQRWLPVFFFVMRDAIGAGVGVILGEAGEIINEGADNYERTGGEVLWDAATGAITGSVGI